MKTVQVATTDDEPLPLAATLVTSLVNRTLEEHGIGASRIQVVFSSDEHLRELKRRYLGQDYYTDVIAFQMSEPDEDLEGEIYISPERALENSRIYNETYHRELMRLVIHGCLHLLGYEDSTLKEKSRMSALEDALLSTVNSEDIR